MFKFKPTTKTYSDPVSATFLPGIPFGRDFSRGDICLLNDGFQSSKVFLNSKVLREAMLNSAEYLEEVLNISIKDKAPLLKESPKDMEVVEAPVAKPKSKGKSKNLIVESETLTEEVVIEGVNEIPEGAEVVDEVVIDAPEDVANKIVEELN